MKITEEEIEKNPHSIKQFSELVESLEKVGVSDKQSRNSLRDAENENKVSVTKEEPKISSVLPPPTKPYQPKPLSSQKILHPTTKTLTSSTYNPIDTHHIKPPFSTTYTTPDLTPISELIKMLSLPTNTTSGTPSTPVNPIKPTTKETKSPLYPEAKPDTNTPQPESKLNKDKTKGWRRHDPAVTRKKDEKIQLGKKRKEEDSDHGEHLYDERKKPRDVTKMIIDATAEAVEQPRRSS